MKKFISIMLAVIMVFGLLPMNSFAQMAEADEKITASATNEGVETVETEDASVSAKATTTVSGNTYQRVSKIDSTTANYLIVYEGGTTKKAFTGYGTGNIQGAASNAVDVNITSLGKDSNGNGIYRITKADGSALATNSKWRFSKKAETALTAYPMYITNASNGYFIQGASTVKTGIDDNRIYNENPASYTTNGGTGKVFDTLYLNKYPIAPEAGSTKLWTGTNMYNYANNFTTSSKIKPRGGLSSGVKFLAAEVAQAAQSIKSFYSNNSGTNGNTSMPKVVPINHGGATYLITLFDWYYMACQILKAASSVTPMTAVTYRPTVKPSTEKIVTARDYNSHTTARLTQIATDTITFIEDSGNYQIPGYDYRYGDTPCYVLILCMANWLDAWHDSQHTNSDGTKGGSFVTKPSSASCNYDITYQNSHSDGTSYTSGNSTPPYLYFEFGGRDVTNHLAIKDNDGNNYGYSYTNSTDSTYGGWQPTDILRNDPNSSSADGKNGTRGYIGTEGRLYAWGNGSSSNPVFYTGSNMVGVSGTVGTYEIKAGDVLEAKLKVSKAMTANTLMGVKLDKETAWTYPTSQSKSFAADTYYTFTFNVTTEMQGKKITQIRLDPVNKASDAQYTYDYVYIGPKVYAPSYTNPDSVTSGAKSDFIKTPSNGTEYENCMIVIPAASSADTSQGTNKKFSDANMESDRFLFAWYNNNNSIYYNTSYLRYTDGRYSDRFVFSPSHYKYTQLLSHSGSGTASRVGFSHAFQPDPLNASGGYLTLNDANTSDANASALPDEFSSFVHYMAPAYMTIYKEISSATVTTPDTPEVVEEPKLEKDNPLYPAVGSTQINKSTKGVEWESTGVGEVELSVKGVGYRKYTDFVVVMDLSKSLWDNGKANASQSAVNSFIDTILKTTLAPSNNRIALVTFGNYATKAQDFTNDPQALKNAVATQITTASALTRNDTNYDDAFRKANEYLNSRTDKSREGVILFLTDGAPSFYNDNHAWNYWGVSSASDTFASSSLVSIDKTNALATTGARVDDNKRYSTTTNLWASGTTGFDFFEDAFMYSTTSEAGTGSTTVSIDGGENAMYQRFVLNTSHIYSDIAKKNGYEVYAIGLELNNGSAVTTKVAANTATKTTSLPYVFFDASETKKIVKGVASDASHYMETTVANVQSQFKTIADNYTVGAGFYQDPATGAVVTDKISVDYDLQYLAKGAVTPAITVKQYPTITYEMIGTTVNGETVTLAHVGNRITSEEPTVLETVTFGAEGEATSSELEGNIWMGNASTGTIAGKYFTYEFATETFTWNVGTVLEDELTLTYNVYLNGSKEGTRPRGIYNVAEEAQLTYTNLDNNEVTKDFPEANLAWGGAVTRYEYYLVNEDGIPVNLLGERVGTDDRTVVYGPISKDVNLNASSGGQAITATLNIPKGYTLYNPDASYTVTTSSDGSNGDITINDTGDTTIIINGDFNESHIAFAVKYNDGAVDDYVVLDWDKKVQIDVTKNDVTMENPKLVAIALNEDGSDATSTNGVAINGRTSTLPVTTTAVDGVFGNASIVDGKVEYALDAMMTGIEQLFCWIQEGDSAMYSPSKLRIIPATNIYYEDSFYTGSATANDTQIYFNNNWSVVGEEDNEYQSSGSEAFGYDSSYNDDKTDSNGSSRVLISQNTTLNSAAMSFRFQGTGFDIIGRTSTDTGSILYRITNDVTGKVIAQYVVNTLYKYGTFYQLPIISWETEEYGMYKVELFAFGTQATPQKVYVDGIRIYNPLGVEKEDTAPKASGILIDFEGEGAINSDIAQWRYSSNVTGLKIENGAIKGTATQTATNTYFRCTDGTNSNLSDTLSAYDYTIAAGDVIEVMYKVSSATEGTAPSKQTFTTYLGWNSNALGNDYRINIANTRYYAGYQVISAPIDVNYNGGDVTGRKLTGMDLRFTNLNANDEFEVDYVYIGPAENAPSASTSGKVLIEFDGRDKLNSDATYWQRNSNIDDAQTTINTKGGIFSTVVKADPITDENANQAPYFRTESFMDDYEKSILSSYGYKGKAGDVIQIRFRVTAQNKHNGNIGFYLAWGIPATSDSYTKAGSISSKYDGYFHTATAVLKESNITSGEVLSELMVVFAPTSQDIPLDDGDIIEVDYIYVGPAEDAPTSNNKEYDDARDAYNTQHELNPVIFEVRPLLFTGTTEKELDSAIFIDGSMLDDENSTTNMSDAYKFGPNNELYLSKNQTLAFNVTTLEVPSSIQIGAKSPFGANVKFTVASTGVVPITQSVTSATNMYYNITSGLQVAKNADGTYTAAVIITNVSDDDAILALTDIKVVAGNTTVASISANQQLVDAAIEYTDKVKNEGVSGDEIAIIGGIEYENGKTIKSTSVFNMETMSKAVFDSVAKWYFSYLG